MIRLLLAVALTAALAASQDPRALGTHREALLSTQEPPRMLGAGPGTALPVDEDLITFGWNTFRTGASQFNGSLGAQLNLKPLWSQKIGGVSNAQPLVVTTASRHVVIAASEGGFVLAFDLFTGKQLWKTNVGVDIDLNCLDLGISGHFGVGGSPVYDPQTGLIYAVGGTGVLKALALSSGKVKWSLKLVDGSLLHSYAALNLVGRNVLITFAGHCDIGNYFGQAIAVDVDQRKLVAGFYPSLPETGGGIWGTAGVAQATTGFLVATGNTKGGYNENDNYGENIVLLDAKMQVLHAINVTHIESDSDFGATPIQVITKACPAPGIYVVQNKNGIFYNVRASTFKILQSIRIAQLATDGQFIGVPAFDPYTETVLVSNPSTSTNFQPGLIGFSVDKQCNLVVKFTTNLPVLGSSGNIPFTSPIRYGNHYFVGNGEWQQVFAIDVASHRVVWNATLPGPVFATPAMAYGVLLVPSWDGKLHAFKSL